METFYSVSESSTPLFSDAYLLDGERFVFGSFWGNESTLQEFFARLSLPNHEHGLRSFTLQSPEGERVRIQAGSVGDLSKLTGKTPPSTVLGAFCHVWIFDPALQNPNRGSGLAYVVGTQDESLDHIRERTWTVVQELSRIPLLDHWCDEVMAMLDDKEWISALDGSGVKGFRITLPADELESEISRSIKSGKLSISLTSSRSAVEQCALF